MKPWHVLPFLAAGRNSQSFRSLHSLSARNAINGHSPVPIPLSTNEYAGEREVRRHFRTRLLAPPVENVWKKASPLKVGRSPRGFCLQVFSNFCASRFLDRGMGTREWSNLRFIRSRCIPLPCASNRRRHLRALELLRYPRALNLVHEAMACSTIPGRRPEQPVLSFAPFSFSSQCNQWPFPCPHSLVHERVRRGA